jgi:hypothetical protein
MHADIQAHFLALVAAVQPTTIPAERKEVIARSVQRMPALYARLQETNESRYSDGITALVQGILMDLEACPEARKLGAAFREKLRQLHEETGVPQLTLKPAVPTKPRKKKRPAA